MENDKIVPIQDMIFEIRGHKVMLDRNLAGLYGVELRALNQAVKRNNKRFPLDFMFRLTQDEWNYLRSHFVIANITSKIRFLPYVFTEQGVAMLSSVINSERAIEVNISIMRAFVKLRHFVSLEAEKNDKIDELRKFLMLHVENTENKFEKQDETIKSIINALNNLIEKPRETRKIGF